MCGIFAAVFVGQPIETTIEERREEPLGHARSAGLDAAAALAAMAHRGPDARGLLELPGATLGHARLAVIDLSPGGRQPMRHAADPNLAITFNGEIYNYRELRIDLERRGERFATRSDTEVILAGYRCFGEGVLERLEGMFAFALLDAGKQSLLVARDRAGEKPLFFSRVRGGLVLASEPKALLAAGLPAELDESSLPFLLAYGYPPPERTMLRGIEQLPPGHLLTQRRGEQPAVRRYYRAPFLRPDAARVPKNVDDAAAAVRSTLVRSVEQRMVADVPLGAFLSGGIDSTIIVGVAAKLLGVRGLRTFSIGFSGDPRYDETRFARIAADALGCDHTEFQITPSSFELVERLVDLHDAPFSDSSAIPTSIVSMLARKHVTVALTGDGGDELFAGYPRFLAAEVAERVPSTVRSLAGGILGRRPPPPGPRSRWMRARRFATTAALPLGERLAAWHSLFLYELEEVLRPEVARRLDLDAPLAWSRSLVASRAEASPLGAVLAHNFESYLPNDLLVKTDRAAMMHSLELRAPFLDSELIATAAAIPDRWKRRGLETKWILKRAFADLLPAPLVHRKKMGFGIPLGAWLSGDLAGYMRESLGPTARIRSWISASFVDGLLEAHLSRRADHGHTLWLLLTLEVFLRGLERRRADRASFQSTPSVASNLS
jgi:asparagine synthase (glutamine-hydrolysing)